MIRKFGTGFEKTDDNFQVKIEKNNPISEMEEVRKKISEIKGISEGTLAVSEPIAGSRKQYSGLVCSSESNPYFGKT